MGSDVTISRVDRGEWFRRVLGWDGLLPVVIVMMPWVIDLIWPNAAKLQTLAAGFVPIIALFVRFKVGRLHLSENHVGTLFLACQRFVFYGAILWLCFLDCFVMALHAAPEIPLGDLIVVFVAYGLYLAAMTFAMYPGRTLHIVPEGDSSGIANDDRYRVQ